MIALTVNEVVALTGIDEKSVRKDVEQGVVQAMSPLRFAEGALVYFRARALFAFSLGTADRRSLYARINDALAMHSAQLELGRGWLLDIGAIAADTLDRAQRFDTWKRKIVVSDDILGGEPVFQGSRLAVRHVGQMIRRGISQDEIREDYPTLSDEDVEFSPIFSIAYPPMGRPRASSFAR